MRRSFIALMLFGAALQAADQPHKHIRVIVDTSESLRRTDPSGHVKLATALLYDLVCGTLELADSFKIIQFDPDWRQKVTKAAPVPMTSGPVIDMDRDSAHRTAVVTGILNLPYDRDRTYFYPVINEAYKELKEAGTEDDNRVIVLITDGVPEPDAREEEKRLLKELAQSLKQDKIHLYILAFGAEVDENSKWFDEAFTFGGADGVSGARFLGKDTSHLLRDTVEIFSQSFGYSKQSYTSTPSQIPVAEQTLARAAVVAIYDQGKEQGFVLTSPAGKTGSQPVLKAVGVPDQHAVGTPKPASYALQWLIPPEKGAYSFRPAGNPIEVAVLRPIAVGITVRPARGYPDHVVMAGKESPFEVVVTPSSGAEGDPGSDLTVTFSLHHVTTDDHRDPKKYPAADTQGTFIKGTGRVFKILPKFSDDIPGKYQGFIDVEISRGDVVIQRSGELMYAATVYPFVSLYPNPNPGEAAVSNSRKEARAGETACATVRFQGTLKNLTDNDYHLGIRLGPTVELKNALRGARVRFGDAWLDTSLDSSKGTWEAAIPVDRQGLPSKEIPICVTLGRPSTGALNPPLSLPIEFGFWHQAGDPYEQLKVVEDFTLHLSVADPDFWQTWGAALTLLLSLLLMCFLAMFWRMRRILAPDLGISLGNERSPLVPARLGEGSILARWLGLPEDRGVTSIAGDKHLGWVRPADRELYAFKPGHGFGNVCSEENGEWKSLTAQEDGTFLVAAGMTYRAGLGADAQLFRIEFAAERPKL